MQPSIFDIFSISLRQAINPFIILLILFVGTLIIHKPIRKTYPGKILLFILLTFFLMSSNSFLMSFGLRNIFIHLLFTYFPLVLFIAPLSYLYISSLVKENFTVRKNELFHLIIPILAFLISLIINIFISVNYVSDNAVQLEYWMNIFIKLQDINLLYILGIQFITYTILCVIVFREHRKNLPHFFSYSDGISLRWVRFFIIGMAFYFLIFLMSNNEILFISSISDSAYDVLYFSISIFFLLLIGIYGAGQYNVFDEPCNIDTNKPKKENKSAYNAFDEERKIEMANKIKNLLREEKIFLKHTLTLDSLADILDSNRSYTSHVINEVFDMNFYNLINKYRIEEAIQMLQDGKHKSYSMEGIGNLCGFTSRSSFNSAFKKFTGKTPSDFK